ncbi:MAG: manganese efflux pump [Clostridia bacterium]|nr:manganese efflux pump [Clostridia bacterium]
MGFFELLLIAIGLSMDAFAVALCRGLGMKRWDIRPGVTVALFFGSFQALMPLLGWLLARQFAHHISAYDHWVAFVLLLFIGGNMILGSFKEDDTALAPCDRFKLRQLLLMAIATSIDALAVGVSLAFLNTPILPAVILIGVITFILSLLGVFIGNFFSARLKRWAELAGGLILILIGAKILFEHLDFI